MRDKDDITAKIGYLIDAAKTILTDVKDQPNIEAKAFIAEQDALYTKGKHLREDNEHYDFMDALGDIYHILNTTNKC